jgi:hypothetical protein
VWLGSWLWKKNWPRQWKKEFLELRPALLLVTEKQEAEKQPASQPASQPLLATCVLLTLNLLLSIEFLILGILWSHAKLGQLAS